MQQDVSETIIPETQEQMQALHAQDGGEIMYLTSNNMLVVPQTENGSVVTFQENFMECQVIIIYNTIKFKKKIFLNLCNEIR